MDESEKYLQYKPKITLEQGIKDYVAEIRRLFEEEVKS